MTWDLETDLVVVGGGGCGLMAAFVAARAGVEVIVLEKDTKFGCNTELASGSIPAAGTRYQKAAGIQGSAEQMADDIMRKNHGRADRGLVLELCRRSREIVDLIVDEVGLPLTLNTDAGRAGFSFLRLHNPPGRTGAPLVSALRDALRRFPNATFADETPGKGLVVEDGAVTGVRAGPGGEQCIGARKTLLACDGFGASRAMLERHIPEMAGVEYIGVQGNTGDGIRWGVELGAATAHMSGYQGHGLVCAGYGTRLTPEVPQLGAVIVNRNGERFADEKQGYSEFARVVLGQPGGVAVAIFDQRIYDIVAPTDRFKDTIASGALRSSDTAAGLASHFKLPEANLALSLKGSGLKPPFHAALITGALAHTQGGLVVDLNARVLRADGRPIPNLYAGGGTAAGISGDGPDGYLSGNGLLSALGLGLIAGEHAAETIKGVVTT
jgi:fumarate reductase flavoprotein subunit